MESDKDKYIRSLEAENDILRAIILRCGITEENISEFRAMGITSTLNANDAFNMFLKLKGKDE